MAVPSTQLDIHNFACDRIGETDPILSIGDTRATNKVCLRHYDSVVKRVLEEYPWPFATRQIPMVEFTYAAWSAVTTYAIGARVTVGTTTYQSLAGTNVNYAPATSPTWWSALSGPRAGWKYAYTLPTDCVAPRALLVGSQRISLTSPTGRIPFDVYANDAGDGQLLVTDYAADEADFTVLEYTALITTVSAWSQSFLNTVVYRLASELALAVRKDPALAQTMLMLSQMAFGEATTSQQRGRQLDNILPDSIRARG